eukprot:CAMPEP_0206579160 /NCGR_PEP_ID=MMETSP0325_2-20121206/32390_1 /ASSEMBLY_ACC=CAM_ASM_000347 /TAXON_ID=2866 /ORGANISM="Crypthecodinium cohnii, Strain Seligo" /LENGTH=922 /DNA_ID=CAMNT_0054084931 /DNA_START=50 /DNA_END=2818 /DNA_ORIENTATION=+
MPPKASKFFQPNKAQEAAQKAAMETAAAAAPAAAAPKKRGFNIPKKAGNIVEMFDLTKADCTTPKPKEVTSEVPPGKSDKSSFITPPKEATTTQAQRKTPLSAPPPQGEPPAKARRVGEGTTKAPPSSASTAAAAQAAAPKAAAAAAAAASKAAAAASTDAAAAAAAPPAAAAAPPAGSTSSRAASASNKSGSTAAAAANKPGAAAVPASSSLPLAGLTFAFTGELDSMNRVDAEEKVKTYGGKVAGSVSGNTSFLVVGSHLEDGRAVEETSKYRKYLELKAKGKKFPGLLNEQELIAKFPASAAPAAPPVAISVNDLTANSKGPASEQDGPIRRNWVDAYAPKSMDEVVTTGGVVRKLTEWLRDWDDVVLKGKKKPVAFRPGGGQPDNINARAVLVSGPPGIGKTTTCKLVAQLHGGYNILEYNASDARGQKIINEMAEGIADNTTICFGGGGLKRKTPGLTSRAVIIMDEVDGMGAGDRGGNAALIKMIKKTRNPIICICNDQNSQKIRSLANSCYDLKFSRPAKNLVAQRCGEIARREGLAVEPNAIEALAESCGGDMRMVLNQMQALSGSSIYQNNGVKYTDMRERLSLLAKDQASMLGPFDAAKKLLNSSEASRLSLMDKMDMFFVDSQLVGLMVQENYLRTVDKKSDLETLNRAAYSADLFSVSDIIANRITADQQWSLLPDVGLIGCVYPTFITNGFVPFPNFPSFLGKYSTIGKSKRLMGELQAHLKLSTSVSSRQLLTSGYTNMLYDRLMAPLVQGAPEAVKDTASLLDLYGLRKEHLNEHLSELRQFLGQKNLFVSLDPKVKAAMTREFNSGSHAMKVVLPSAKRRRTDGPSQAQDIDGAEVDEEEAVAVAGDSDAEGSDDGELGSLVKVKGKAKAKGKAKGKAKADSSSAATSSSQPKAKGKGKAKAKART